MLKKTETDIMEDINKMEKERSKTIWIIKKDEEEFISLEELAKYSNIEGAIDYAKSLID